MHRAVIPGLIIVLAGCAGGGSVVSSSQSPTAASPWPTYPGPATNPPNTPEPVTYRLQEVKAVCKAMRRSKGLSGSRAFLAVDTANEYDTKGIKTIGCVLSALDTPKYVIKMMEGTTALMGIQKIKADGLKYRWSYHPDNGLDLIVIDPNAQ